MPSCDDQGSCHKHFLEDLKVLNGSNPAPRLCQPSLRHRPIHPTVVVKRWRQWHDKRCSEVLTTLSVCLQKIVLSEVLYDSKAWQGVTCTPMANVTPREETPQLQTLIPFMLRDHEGQTRRWSGPHCRLLWLGTGYALLSFRKQSMSKWGRD